MTREEKIALVNQRRAQAAAAITPAQEAPSASVPSGAPMTREQKIALLNQRRAQASNLSEDLFVPVVEEQSPYISLKDREIIKNLGNPKSGLAMIKQKYPDLKARIRDGQIQVRGPGETAYRVDDPNPSFPSWAFVKDIPADIADVAGDTARNIISGAAATSAGLATLPFGGGIPGAMAVGGLTGYQLEKAKQDLGAMAGLPDNYSEDAALTEAALNAAPPLVGRAAKGIYGVAKNTVLPRLASAASGVPAEVYRDLGKNYKRVIAWDANPELPMAKAEDVKETVLGLAKEAKDAEGAALLKTATDAEAAGVKVDTTPVRKLVGDEVRKKYEQYVRFPSDDTKAAYEEMARLGGIFGEEATDAATGAPYRTWKSPVMSPVDAHDLKKLMDARAKFTPTGTGVKPETFSASKDVAATAQRAYGTQTGAIGEVVPGYAATAEKFKPALETAKQMDTGFKDTQTTLNTIRNLDKANKSTLKSRLEMLARKNPEKAAALAEDIQALQTQQFMGVPSSTALSIGGGTSTSRTVPMAGAGGLLGYALASKLAPQDIALRAMGAAAGTTAGAAMGSPRMIKRGYGLLNAAEQLPPLPPSLQLGAGRSLWDLLNQENQ